MHFLMSSVQQIRDDLSLSVDSLADALTMLRLRTRFGSQNGLVYVYVGWTSESCGFALKAHAKQTYNHV